MPSIRAALRVFASAPFPPFRRCAGALCLALVVFSVRDAFAIESSVRTRAVHPQDGPDIEVTLRISDDDVVLGLLMNLNFVDEIVDVPREDPQFLAEIEQAGVRDALLEVLREEVELRIDGVPVTPVLDEFTVSELTMDLLPLFPRTGRRALIKVWTALRFDAKTPPESVSIVWGIFPPERILETTDPGPVDPPPGLTGPPAPDVITDLPPMEIKIRLIASGVERIIDVSQDEPEHTWHDEGGTIEERLLAVPEAVAVPVWRVPLVSLGCLAAMLLVIGGLRLSSAWDRRRGIAWMALPLGLLGAVALRDVSVVDVEQPFAGPSLPTEARAKEIFRPLHANIYRAFDYVDESDVYDALAYSVDGELLDGLYDQIYRSLIMQEEGGAISRVESVRMMDIDVESIGVLPENELPGFVAVARWQVDGAVHHWGHSHERTNEYEARYTVHEGLGGWRIAGSQVLEQFRVESSPFDDILQGMRDL